MYLSKNGKNMKLTSILVLSAITLGLVGCGSAPTNQSAGGSIENIPVGPTLSSNFGQQNEASKDAVPAFSSLQLEVAIPVFDPNLSPQKETKQSVNAGKNDDRYHGGQQAQSDTVNLGIWPELRRAESTRFALNMKTALEDTKAFGAVRVVPSPVVTADFYVQGKIINSNGEDVEIEITAYDISGRKWFTKSFSHRVDEKFYSTFRNKGKDSYEPVFKKAADYIVEQLKKQDENYLRSLPPLKQIRFASSLSEETFAKYMARDGNRVKLVAFPAESDPMLQRINVIRVRDQLFTDRMQAHYMEFNSKLNESYLVWQERTLPEAKAARKAKKASSMKTFLGALAIGLAVAGASRDDYSYDSGTRAATAAALVGGVLAIRSGLQDNAESRVHLDALNELGESLDLELGPQVVEFEDETEQLVGNASEQYLQWIEFLRKIYELEATPETQL